MNSLRVCYYYWQHVLVRRNAGSVCMEEVEDLLHLLLSVTVKTTRTMQSDPVRDNIAGV